MNLADFTIALQPPRYLSGKSAWVQHIPFAFAAIDWLRPRSFVELGTYMGDSYFAFCQAVDVLSLKTQCTAVDTWTGDRHSGQYSPDILADVQRHHDPNYGNFSRLLRSSFDDAAADTPNQSVDILHIDGFHTYDAVRHDFETWLPKLSDRGVICLHDTQIKQDNFGVFSLWDEMRQAYPSFEFTHGYGLGILAVGNAVPSAFLSFLTWANGHKKLAGAFFEALGIRIELAGGTAHVNTALHAQRTALLELLSLDDTQRSDSKPLNGDGASTLLNRNVTELKPWLDRQINDIGEQTELLRLLQKKRVAANPAVFPEKPCTPDDGGLAVLSLYWPNDGGEFDAQNVNNVYLPADGKIYTARFCVDLAPGITQPLRLDPGNRPGVWRIQGVEIRLLDGSNGRRISLPASAIRAIAGLTILNASAHPDAHEGCDYTLFCESVDPQLELSIASYARPPCAVSVTCEVTVHCRVWNTVAAYFATSSAQGEDVVTVLRGLLAAAAFK